MWNWKGHITRNLANFIGFGDNNTKSCTIPFVTFKQEEIMNSYLSTTFELTVNSRLFPFPTYTYKNISHMGPSA